MTAPAVVDLRTHDDLDDLDESPLLDLHLGVRALLAARLMRDSGSESLEMLSSHLAEVVEPPAQPPVATARISPREREVLHFVAPGRRNAGTAVTLFISENTVKNHLRSIFTKYEVTTRQAAVLAAIREETLTVD